MERSDGKQMVHLGHFPYQAGHRLSRTSLAPRFSLLLLSLSLSEAAGFISVPDKCPKSHWSLVWQFQDSWWIGADAPWSVWGRTRRRRGGRGGRGGGHSITNQNYIKRNISTKVHQHTFERNMKQFIIIWLESYRNKGMNLNLPLFWSLWEWDKHPVIPWILIAPITQDLSGQTEQSNRNLESENFSLSSR